MQQPETTVKQRSEKILIAIIALLQKAYDSSNKKAGGDAYLAALEEVAGTDVAGGDEPLFSLRETKKGKLFVKESRDVIRGKNPEKWAQQVKDYINKEIRKGKDIVVLGKNDTPLTISDYTVGKLITRTRMRGADSVFKPMNRSFVPVEVTHGGTSGQGFVKKPDFKGGHLFATEFSYRSALFKDKNGDIFVVTISVGRDGKKNTVYNIGDIQRTKKSVAPTKKELKGSLAPVREPEGNTSEKNVPQPDTTVKDKKPRFSLKDPLTPCIPSRNRFLTSTRARRSPLAGLYRTCPAKA